MANPANDVLYNLNNCCITQLLNCLEINNLLQSVLQFPKDFTRNFVRLRRHHLCKELVKKHVQTLLSQSCVQQGMLSPCCMLLLVESRWCVGVSFLAIMVEMNVYRKLFTIYRAMLLSCQPAEYSRWTDIHNLILSSFIIITLIGNVVILLPC